MTLSELLEVTRKFGRRLTTHGHLTIALGFAFVQLLPAHKVSLSSGYMACAPTYTPPMAPFHLSFALSPLQLNRHA